MPDVQITYRYAEWKEDAVVAPLPDHIDPTDADAIDEWGRENYKRLYNELCDTNSRMITAGGAFIAWEDQFVADLDFPEAEYKTEVVG
jgi:hypothetical protein